MADPWVNFMMKTHCSWRKPCNCLVWVVGLTFHSVNKIFAGNIGNQGSFRSTSRWSTVDLQNLQIFRRAKWTFHFEFKFHASCKISKNGSPSSSSISPISPCFFFLRNFYPLGDCWQLSACDGGCSLLTLKRFTCFYIIGTATPQICRDVQKYIINEWTSHVGPCWHAFLKRNWLQFRIDFWPVDPLR